MPPGILLKLVLIRGYGRESMIDTFGVVRMTYMFTVYIGVLQVCPGTGKSTLTTKLFTIINNINRTNSILDYILINCIML